MPWRPKRSPALPRLCTCCAMRKRSRASAVVAVRALTMLNSETVAQLIMSALVSGVTIAGKACGKNIATGKATQIVHTTSKLIYYIKSLFTGKLPKKKKK